MGFTQDAADMDDDVDALLGDEIEYKVAGTTTYVTLLGFANVAERDLPFAELDTAPTTRRVKISMSKVQRVTSGDRLRCPLLGAGTFAPMNKEPYAAGRYWIFDVQRASTNL